MNQTATTHTDGATASTGPRAAVEVANLSHTYPARRGQPAVTALSDVSLRVSAGEIFGVLGPNGGGKSTLFRILVTMLRPTEGRARVHGVDVTADPAVARSLIGVVFQSPSLDGKLTAAENLRHEGHMFGLRGPQLRQRAEALLQRFGLAGRADAAVETFSGGMRRRVELAKAMLHEPRVLLMDEPSTGLDPGARSDLWRLLRELRNESGVTVLLTTHLMDEAEHCDRLGILAEGRLVASGTPAALKAQVGDEVVVIDPAADQSPEQIDELLSDLPMQGEPQWIDGRLRLEIADADQAAAELARRLHGRVRHLTIGQPSLEDVFLHVTGHRFDRA